MDIREAITERHSVRQFKDEPIADELVRELNELIVECNEESGLNIQLILDDPECFNTLLGRYGKFKNADNYIAVVGPSSMPDLDEKAGYYGQKLVLEAQRMGLRTCWVAGTYGKGKCKADREKGEKIVLVIAIGYGENDGTKNRSRPVSKVCSADLEEAPAWFRNGVRAAMLAPTAMNQQRFTIDLEDGEAVIKAGRGPLTKVDLGIVKYNFEAASGHRCR